MTASYSPVAHWKFWTQGGVPAPAAGYQLWFYQAGTTTLQSAFTDTTGTVPCTNPLILDTNGECNFCLSDSLAYKILLTDAANGPSTPGNTQTGWPVDNIQSGTLSALTAIEALLLNATVVTDGAGMISFYPLLSYPANTVGNALKGAASSASLQNNAYTYFVSTFDVTGIPAFKLTPSPATLGYVVGQQFFWHAHSSGVTGYNTLNINGLGAWPVIYIDQFGNQQPAQILSGIDYQVEYIGSAFRILNPLPPTGNATRGRFKNLSIFHNGTGSSTITADEIILKNASGDSQIVSAYSQTLNLGATGAGGLDTGTVTTNTPYYIYAIWGPATNPTNGTPLVSVIASLNYLTPPTLPTYYTHWARLGSFITDGSSGYALCGAQVGNHFEFAPIAGRNLANYPVIASGTAGSITAPTYTNPTLPHAPSTLSAIDIALRTSGTGTAMVGGFYVNVGGPSTSLTNPPTMMNSSLGVISHRFTTPPFSVPGVYCASSDTGAVLMVTGWEDNL